MLSFLEFLRESDFTFSKERFEIGIGVSGSIDDPGYLDFWVFAWPDPVNTVSDQGRYLESKLGTDDRAYVDFYNAIASGTKHTIDGENVYGPFAHITDII